MRTSVLHTLRWLTLLSAAVLCPAHADVYTDVAGLLADGKPTQAMAAAQNYLATQPRDPQMRFLVGVIQNANAQPALAEQTFTQLTQEYPELPEPYNNLAVMFAAQGAYDKARDALEMAIRANPQYSTAYENLGDVYAALAAQAYGKSVQFDARRSTAAPKLKLVQQLLATSAAPAQSR